MTRRDASDGIDYELLPAAMRPPRAHRDQVAGVELDPFTQRLDREALPPVRLSFPQPTWLAAGAAYVAVATSGRCGDARCSASGRAGTTRGWCSRPGRGA